ncbi:MAG TPA: antibiotic biosynthesis monooxygenase [Steroidobacteraceae bacterium]
MVIREWRGRASRSNAALYPVHFRDVVVPDLRQVPGFVGAVLSHREMADRVEYLVLTQWVSMDAIKGFAGPMIEQAVVEPGAIHALESYDSTVTHYDVLQLVS